MDLNTSEDFCIIDGLETCFLMKTRNIEDGTISFDPDSGQYSSGNSVENSKIEMKECLFRLIGERNQSLVKQVFQRGVALAALDFSVADCVIELYNQLELFPKIEMQDIILREDTGEKYVLLAKDISKQTKRIRLACRRNL